MHTLNSPQAQAVRYLDGPLLVLAGAGSGKTRVITRKIRYLIEDAQIPARHILAVTFTNKAAREMQSRVAEACKGVNRRGLSISTFHTLGLNMIRRAPRDFGLKSGFSIYDDGDTLSLLKELSGNSLASDSEILKSMRYRIGDWKNRLVLPADAAEEAEDDLVARAAKLYAEYQLALESYNAVDFDDLILRPVLTLRHNDDVRSYWQSRIRHLLVDEYQDTNATQYELVQLLVGERASFTVVGDDDQSIYAWRGARPDNLVRLQSDYPQLKLIKLEQNYRSTAHILHAANALIENNPHVFEKKLWCDAGHGETLRALQTLDEFDEAQQVVAQLISHRLRHGNKYNDYAILYRSNFQSRPIEKLLREHRVPYLLSGGTSFFAQTEVRDLMAYLRLLVNPDDDAAFLRVVNVPRRQLGPATLKKLSAYAEQREVSLLTATQELGLQQTVTGAALDNLASFGDWVARLADQAERGDPIATVRQLVNESDYRTWVADNADTPAQEERRLGNVEELLEWLDRLTEKADEEQSLAELVSKMVLMDILERQNEEGDGDAVRLMTLHAAKGLEFPHVFIVGMEEEILPHRTSIEEENIEEERRLAYVGITRARNSLTFTYAAKRKRYGELQTCEPSRFLKELPAENLQWAGNQEERAPEQQQATGNDALSQMRAMLARQQ
ncbi:MAG: DNA helicase Rep [Immundisolibacteraceae bacterium]|nr:DNA helicase Rep [Immundisolibacteraceae bacterium]